MLLFKYYRLSFYISVQTQLVYVHGLDGLWKSNKVHKILFYLIYFEKVIDRSYILLFFIFLFFVDFIYFIKFMYQINQKNL